MTVTETVTETAEPEPTPDRPACGTQRNPCAVVLGHDERTTDFLTGVAVALGLIVFATIAALVGSWRR